METWQLLRELKKSITSLGFCVGNFNEILGGHEEGNGVGSIQGCGG